jgi:hypothetical protein
MRARDRILTPTGALRAGPAIWLSLLGIALAFGFTIAYVGRVAAAQRAEGERSRAAVCALVNSNVAAYSETPPATAAGRNIAASWVELKAQLGC